jgi:hypothetical protein
MAVHRDAIAASRQFIKGTLADLRDGAGVLKVTGTASLPRTMKYQLAFQQRRVRLCEWLEQASEADIRTRLADLAEQLGPHGRRIINLRYADGLSRAQVERKSFAELCLIALGEHPGQRGPARKVS